MQKYVKCTCFYVTTCFFIESPALGFFSSLHFYNNWVCLDLCRFCLSAIENKNPSIQFVTITFTRIQWPNVRYFLRVFFGFFSVLINVYHRILSTMSQTFISDNNNCNKCFQERGGRGAEWSLPLRRTVRMIDESSAAASCPSSYASKKCCAKTTIYRFAKHKKCICSRIIYKIPR